MSPVIKKSSNETNESAVSPVVGVMLMLVVTIIIAAIVSAFAGGVMTSSEASPSAVLNVEINSKWTDGYETYNSATSPGGSIFIENVNGDDIDTSKMAVKLTNSSGSSYKFTCSNPTVYYGTDYTKIQAGHTFNVAYWTSPSYVYLNTSTVINDVIVKSGETARVTITYNNQHVLYDKEVTVL